jgi:Ca2+/Na+ antiporter
MVVVRLISLIFVALALMVLGADILFWLETGTFDPRKFIDLWKVVNSGSAEGVQAFANSLPDFVSAILNAILSAWAFVVLGLPGVILAIIGGRR